MTLHTGHHGDSGKAFTNVKAPECNGFVKKRVYSRASHAFHYTLAANAKQEELTVTKFEAVAVLNTTPLKQKQMEVEDWNPKTPEKPMKRPGSVLFNHFKSSRIFHAIKSFLGREE